MRSVRPSAFIVVCSWYFSCFDMSEIELKKAAHAFWANLKAFSMMIWFNNFVLADVSFIDRIKISWLCDLL